MAQTGPTGVPRPAAALPATAMIAWVLIFIPESPVYLELASDQQGGEQEATSVRELLS